MKFNYYNFSVISFSLYILFKAFLELRQYSVVHEYLAKTLEPYKGVMHYCSRDMDLTTHSNYPKCPVEAKNAIINYNASKIQLQVGTFMSSLVEFLYLGIFVSGFFKRINAGLENEASILLNFFIFSFIMWLPSFTANLLTNLFSVFYMIPKFLAPDVELPFFPILGLILSSLFINFSIGFCQSGVLYMLTCVLPIYAYIPTMSLLMIGNAVQSTKAELAEFETEILPKSDYHDNFSPLIRKSGFPAEKVLMATSARTEHPMYQDNALMIGGFGHYWMFISDGILKALSLAEVKGVIGHEIGHWAHSHINQRAYSAIAYGIVYYLSFHKFRSNETVCDDFGIIYKDRNNVAAYFIWDFTTKWFSILIAFYTNGLGQDAELQSDVYSARLGYGPGLKTGLAKITGGQHPIDPLIRRIFLSHPGLEERYYAIDRTMREMKYQKPRNVTKKTTSKVPRNTPRRSRKLA